MNSTLTRFRIVNLHGSRNIDIPIVDNRLVLVGENGAGKSTVANLIYYCLTHQWQRVARYEFESIGITLNGEEHVISHAHVDITRLRARDERARHIMSPTLARRIDRVLEDIDYHGPIDNLRSLEQLADVTGLPLGVVREYVNLVGEQDLQFRHEMSAITKAISEAVVDQVLYLPTYRRIEQDLESIFRGMRTEIEPLRKRLTEMARNESYVELVEFGMVDVDSTIIRRMNEIKENVRTGLSNLTGTYLRDVIRGDYENVDLGTFLRFDDATVDSILDRIDDQTLPPTEKVTLRHTIREVNERNLLPSNARVVGQFLSRLYDLYQAQQSNERDVRDFIDVCNSYLAGKQMIYDDVNFSVSIERTTPRERRDSIRLQDLSSGEKQIVSLFAHIYLSGRQGYYVVIDEPELSLSVPWQRSFLPDILKTSRCNGLVAVTHSPFIYDNDLDAYAHALEEFVEPRDVVS